ncbi:MAG: methyltransferase [bacterium]|nr:methyltransferase [bacterium]
MRTTNAIAIGLVFLMTATGLMAQGRRGRGRGPRGGGMASLGTQPLAADAAEKRILDVAAQVPRAMNVPLEDARVIRMMTEAIGAKNAVEIGTSTGVSGLWFALALRKTGGKLTTFEIDPGRAATAREHFKKAGVDHLITVVMGDAHENVKKLTGPIDIVFIDADKPGYRDYLESVLPLVRPGGLILAHNISNREQNPEYVDAVTTNPALESIIVGSQMAVTLKKR